MKKLVLSLIAIVGVALNGNAQNLIKPEESGFYHNEGLELLRENKSEWVGMNTSQIIEFAAKQMANKYPKQFSNVDLKVVHENFDDYTYGKFSYEDCVKVWERNKEEYLKSNKLSPITSKVMDKIIAEEPTVEEALGQIENALKSKDLKENDINSLIVAKSILKSSNEYWLANPNSYTKANPIRAWIADTVITLLFWEAGPVGYLGGQLASAFVTGSGQ